MILIVALVTDALSRTRISAATGNKAIVIFCDSLRALRVALESDYTCAIIAEAQGKQNLPRLSAIRRIAETHPFIPIVALTNFDKRSIRALFMLRGTPFTDVIFADSDAVANAVDLALDRAGTAAARNWAANAMLPILPGFAFRIVELFLLYDSGFPGSDEISTALEISQRTLRHRLDSAGLPGAHRLIAHAQVLLAVRLLQDSKRKLHEVSRSVGFVNPASLRALMRELADMNPAEARQPDACARALDAFRRAIASESAAIPV